MQEKSGWVKQAVPPARHTGNLLNRAPPAQLRRRLETAQRIADARNQPRLYSSRR